MNGPLLSSFPPSVSPSSSPFARLSGRVRGLVRKVMFVGIPVYDEEEMSNDDARGAEREVTIDFFGRRFRSAETLQKDAEDAREALQWMRQTVSRARIDSWKQIYTLGGNAEVEKLMHEINVFDGSSVSGSIAYEYASEIRQAFEELEEQQRSQAAAAANKTAGGDADESEIPLVNLTSDMKEEEEDVELTRDWLYSGADPMTFSEFPENEPQKEPGREEEAVGKALSIVEEEEDFQNRFLTDLSWITSWLGLKSKSPDELNEELLAGIQEGDYDKVKKALISGADIEYRSEDGKNALQVQEGAGAAAAAAAAAGERAGAGAGVGEGQGKGQRQRQQQEKEQGKGKGQGKGQQQQQEKEQVVSNPFSHPICKRVECRICGCFHGELWADGFLFDGCPVDTRFCINGCGVVFLPLD
ncbi:hypothetical protein GUITHDRAFT_146156 [Guillardia theta CCMP2712]|uniref:Uncharacterized protein n=1 Tax=Guillardia theta (strain CCMP2712) TaxID=905079 RepID=L1II31_GUITC|nr:hypothetical protein GUITHDRAFT_146156 [Guillardia theta CCMP2712]EKX35903.1 hypothetical protein GUITHDRAFT_146156 [Guillardia theta CCMP2712]|eukprot:XP_005822883.1 hypothetical protein GUITHDRAFT_146156 [Guillardia theta CCMP2712]